MTRLLLAAAAALVLAQQTRDLPRAPDSGTASLSGIVVTDERESFDSRDRALAQDRPLRRVRVVVSSTDAEVSRTTITDDSGGFLFERLPAGRYTVSGTKEGYVTVSYGARRPGRPGSAIAVAERQAIKDVTLRLPRGAVITGTLLDADGQPLPGVGMRAMRYTYTAAGERRLTPVYTGMASHVTDDRGVYRIYGLAAGDYAIAAPVRLPRETDGDVVLMTDDDIRRGLAELKAPTRQPQAADASTTFFPDDSPRAGYAPVFYPGTPVAAQAITIAVAAGEERREIDFPVQFVPMSTVRGTVLAPDGVTSEYMKVHLIPSGVAVVPGGSAEARTAAVARTGVFSLSNVAPGSYTLVARGTRGPGPQAPVFWATTEVVADGQTQFDLSLALQPALSLAGKVAFEGTTTPPDPARVRVTLSPVLSGAQVSLATAPAEVNSIGQFTVRGITPAFYRVQVTVMGQSTWMLKSGLVNGRESLDAPLDLRASLDGVVLTLTDRPAELSGIVQDAAGQPAGGYSVVLFPAERTLWIPGGRRIRAVTASPSGSYVLRGLPAGEYFLAAVADAEENEWFDPVFLERLVESSIRITLAEGEKKSQPLAGR